jgi:16S rRNA C967 or C1407 C5-methylase (RsmB/RsmF family)
LASKKSKGYIKGQVGFDAHYQTVYGDQWPQLKAALSLVRQHVTLSGLVQDYHLDGASTVPPQVLNVQPGDEVLDMCAAPGGKSLQLALAMKGQGRLVLNEMSRTRRNRLARVVDEHLTAEQRDIVRIWCQDASLLCLKSPDRFHKILLDAPCSSERHLLEHEDELGLWSIKRTKNLAQRQMGLLCSALTLLKPGGQLVYSTCSISPLENELNIEKLLKKRAGQIKTVPIPDAIMGEAKQHGVLIRPDLHDGLGPMYTVLLEKMESAQCDGFDSTIIPTP